MHRAKVMQVIPLVDGIFKYMNYTFWDFTYSELDIILQSRMGQRPVAPLLDIIQGPPVDPCAPRAQLTPAQLTQLASIILKTFKPKWDRLSSLHSLDYDILRNYIDEYKEVLKDSKESASVKAQEMAKENQDSNVLSTHSGVEGIQNSVSSNDSASQRSDQFTSGFTRASSELETRSDDLSEVKDKAKAATEKRTDDLADGLTSSGSDNKTISGGDYQLSKTSVTATAGEGTSKDDVYGFNSLADAPVGDTEAISKSVNSGSETSIESATGSKTENVAKSETSTTTHTGTQETENNEAASESKVNTGTQTIADVTSIDDSTTTTDSQTNTSNSRGASSASNESSTTTDTSSAGSSSEVSRLTDSDEISEMLNRAKISIHKGNIGNMSPQQLIEQEINLWRWNFIDEVFDDIKSLITIPIYI